VLQHYGRVEPPLAGITDSIDEDRAFRSFAVWTAGSNTPQEDSMLTLINVLGDPAWFVGEALTPPDGRQVVLHCWHVREEAELTDLQARGVPTLVVSRPDMHGVRLLGGLPPGWSTAEFRDVSMSAAGPQGPQGPRGDIGPSGPQGVPGAKGDAAILTIGSRLIVQ
jgi:hypothetical protein